MAGNKARRHYYSELAPTLVRLGYEVIPVVAGGKRPAQGADWQLKGAKTEADVIRLKPLFSDCSIGIVGANTAALDFDIYGKPLADHMRKFVTKLYGDDLAFRYGFRPKFLVPGRWPDGIVRHKRVSKGYIAADADPLDPKVAVSRVEELGAGQQWLIAGDHDAAGVPYQFEDESLSPLARARSELVEFDPDIHDRIMEEFEWAAEQTFGMVEYHKPGKNGFDHGAGGLNGAAYEPMAASPRPPESAYEIARVRIALAFYSATAMGRNYDAFIEVIMALSWLKWDCGLKLAMDWSAKSPWHVAAKTKYWFEHPSDRNDRAPITISTLFARAKSIGWDGSIPFDEIEDEDNDELTGPDDDLAGPDPVKDDGTPKAKDGVKQRLAKMIERYAVVQVGRNAMIYRNYGPKQVPEPMTIMAFRAMQANNFVDVAKKGSKVVTRVKMAEVFMNSPERPTFDRIAFEPDEITPADTFNLWRGFQVEPIAGDVAPWLELLAALFPDKQDRVYVLNWLALKVQNPGLVPGTFLIMKGDMGIGKGALFSPIIRLFGDHAKPVDKANQLVGQFSGHLEHTVFVVLEEGVFAADPRHVETLKNMVTAEYLTVESKGIDARRVKNHCAFVNLTNKDYTWHTTGQERRAVIFQTPPLMQGSRQFWDRYWPWARSDAGISALFHYLSTVDVSKFDVRDFPKGQGYQDQLERTAQRDAPTAFVQEILESGKLPGRDLFFEEDAETRVPRDVLRESYEEFSRRGFGNYVPGFQVACSTIYQLLDIDAKQSIVKMRNVENVAYRVNGTRFPPLKIMRETYARNSGIFVSMPETDDDDDV